MEVGLLALSPGVEALRTAYSTMPRVILIFRLSALGTLFVFQQRVNLQAGAKVAGFTKLLLVDPTTTPRRKLHRCKRPGMARIGMRCIR